LRAVGTHRIALPRWAGSILDLNDGLRTQLASNPCARVEWWVARGAATTAALAAPRATVIAKRPIVS